MDSIERGILLSKKGGGFCQNKEFLGAIDDGFEEEVPKLIVPILEYLDEREIDQVCNCFYRQNFFVKRSEAEKILKYIVTIFSNFEEKSLEESKNHSCDKLNKVRKIIVLNLKYLKRFIPYDDRIKLKYNYFRKYFEGHRISLKKCMEIFQKIIFYRSFGIIKAWNLVVKYKCIDKKHEIVEDVKYKLIDKNHKIVEEAKKIYKRFEYKKNIENIKLPLYLISLYESWLKDLKEFEIDGYFDKEIIENLPGSIEDLKIRNGEIEKFPKFFKNYKQLKILHLSFNKLKEIPDVIGEITNLKELIVMENKIVKISKCIGKCVNLEKIDLSSNKIKTIPSSISSCKKLWKINFSNNNIDNISSINKLKNLVYINFSFNFIKSLLKGFEELKNLQYIYIEGNEIKEISLDFRNLKELTILKISKNCLKRIPKVPESCIIFEHD